MSMCEWMLTKNELIIDDASQALLQEQNVTLQDIPVNHQKIQLKYVSNMAQGGVATDVTDEIHPIYQKWVADLVDYLNCLYIAISIRF